MVSGSKASVTHTAATAAIAFSIFTSTGTPRLMLRMVPRGVTMSNVMVPRVRLM